MITAVSLRHPQLTLESRDLNMWEKDWGKTGLTLQCHMERLVHVYDTYLGFLEILEETWKRLLRILQEVAVKPEHFAE